MKCELVFPSLSPRFAVEIFNQNLAEANETEESQQGKREREQENKERVVATTKTLKA